MQPHEPEMEIRIVRADGSIAIKVDQWKVKMDDGSFPAFEWFDGNLYTHFSIDYGFHQGIWKYRLDLKAAEAGPRVEYKRAAFSDPQPEPGAVRYYVQAADRAWTARVSAGDPPKIDYRPAEVREQQTGPGRPDPVDLPDGNRVWVRQDPDGAKPGIFWVSPRGKESFYPFPEPTPDEYRVLRGGRDPYEIRHDLRHFVIRGGSLWFAPSFYNGEGQSGVGAIGRFDLDSRKYEMKYLPEIVPCSASALVFDRDKLWIGLEHVPEGAAVGKGLLEYDTKTAIARVYPVTEPITSIQRLGDQIFAATGHGLFVLDTKSKRLTQLRLEPDEKDWLHVVAKDIPVQ